MNIKVVESVREREMIIVDEEHCSRVAINALNTARLLDLDEETCKDIIQAATYHDAGKAFLIKSILNKPDKLTDEEMEHVKYHVLYSAALAIEKRFNVHVIRYIYHHHENFDGTGYPSGLKDRDIPVGARIIRIADFYDALTNDRVYRKRIYSREEAIQILKNNINCLDPDILKIFISSLYKGSNVQLIKNNNIMVLESGTQGGIL